MRDIAILIIITFVLLSSCKELDQHDTHGEHEKMSHESNKEHSGHHHVGILPVTNPINKDTVVYDEFVCQIHSHRHIELRALEKGYLEKVYVDEGEYVRKGQLLFQIQPTIYQSEAKIAEAEVEIAKIEYNNTKALADSNIVSQNELALAGATLEKANAELELTKAHLKFTEIYAPFDGIIGKFEEVRLGSLLDEGEMLTTLSDNGKMWVYFNVPEARYLDYMINNEFKNAQRVKLRLANQALFNQDGIIETIESDFDNNTGNIAFRATFPNKSKLLRHGQTGVILWPRIIDHALMIPQKATFEVLDKKYVFVVDKEGDVRSKEINILGEMDHLYWIYDGLNLSDQILIDGLRKVKNGDKIEYVHQDMTAVLQGLELHAE